MESNDVKISRKKPIYPVSVELRKYLRSYQREARLPVGYNEIRFGKVRFIRRMILKDCIMDSNGLMPC
jgi:hypothetical protein